MENKIGERSMPQWISRMYSSSSGRDHLGLGSVSSNQILQYLSSGINVLTYHPRYYSFFVFLLYEFWQTDRPKIKKEWTKYYRPRAYIFSLAANMCNQPTHVGMQNIVGSQKTHSMAAKELDTYETNFNYIKSALGGYGLYYRSVMAEIGLIYPDNALKEKSIKIDLPTPNGEIIALAFRKTIQYTEYYKEYFHKDVIEVPHDIIHEYSQSACLCRLQTEHAFDRLPLLKQFLYGALDKNEQAQSIELRRATMRFFLDVSNQTHGFQISEDDFRQLIYYGNTDKQVNYEPSRGVELTHQFWRLYQLREYYSFAFNAMWYHFCDWGIANNGDVKPLDIEDFFSYITPSLTFEKLLSNFSIVTKNISADTPFTTFLEKLIDFSEDSNDFSFGLGMDSKINEHKLYRLAVSETKFGTPSVDVMVAGMIVMLGILILKFGDKKTRSSDSWKRISHMGQDGRKSVEGFMRQIDNLLENRNPTIIDVIRWLYGDYIMLQHQVVAASKLPDDTFRFQRAGKQLQFFHYDNPLTFRDSRFKAISTIVHELGLCGDFSNLNHTLSSEGLRILKSGDI